MPGVNGFIWCDLGTFGAKKCQKNAPWGILGAKLSPWVSNKGEYGVVGM